nr:PREDICTED: uncharacterized protein LOC109042060 [Bemisia tabaci]
MILKSTPHRRVSLKSCWVLSADICMEFGLEKCRVLNIYHGKVVGEEEDQTLYGTIVEQMDENDSYKYLGFQQNRGLNHRDIKQMVQQHFEQRLRVLLRSRLNSRNLFKAINTFAVPVLTYSFGIIKWTTTDLENINIKTRVLLTKSRKLHPKSCKERVTLGREVGGRGLLDIHELCNRQVHDLRTYFTNREHPLHQAIVCTDRNFTPLNLASQGAAYPPFHTDEEKETIWASKELHGRHYSQIHQDHISKSLSYKFLQSGQLFPETEGFILAIQDQVIRTRNYRKFVIKDGTVDDSCRKCHLCPETIDHITAGCRLLAGTEYTGRHNSVAKIIHQGLSLHRNLLDNMPPYYEYNPESVLENDAYKLYWDFTIYTDKTIPHNRTDMVLLDKNQGIAHLMDISVPADANVDAKYRDKIEKYLPLATEIQRLWKLKEVIIVPFIISVTGITPHSFPRHLKQLHLGENVHTQSQKAVILHTCNITRSFLNSGQ